MKNYTTAQSLTVILVLLITIFSYPANGQNKDVLGSGQEILVGADYYPEHWPKERWETDAKLMQEAGFNVARLAEFSWINMEPSEGEFDFGWLDEAVEILERHGISVILGTPTAVMPAWVARKYPETLAMKGDGTRIIWGGRKNNCFTSGTYRLLSERITRKMAEHFADRPNVIGWQTDNEFGGTDCRCSTCLGEFQDWLAKKYGTLDELNRAWGNHFWGLAFKTWGEITIPETGTEFWSHGNPSACLDWKRYTSWLNVRFQSDQIKIIREICPEDFITHNLMGFHTDTNYYDLSAELDFVSWDNYPVWWNAPDISYGAAAAGDLMRGFKQKNFLIMEQTAGPCGWGIFSRNTRPGEIRKICYQQLAHGADGQIWFRWRTCTAGREQYWHGLLGHDGKPLRRYNEAAQVAREYRKLQEYLRGTTVVSEAAIIYDFDSAWALDFQPSYKGNNFTAAVRRYYDPLLRAGVNVDMIRPDADLSQYKLVVTPELYILPDKIANNLNEFVHQGGVLLTEFRTGVKDENSLCHKRTLPGLLSATLGIRIEEYSSLDAYLQYKVVGVDSLAGSFTATKFVDWVSCETAEKLASYDEQWHLEPFAVATKNSYGKGKGYYVGTVIKEEGFYDQLIGQVLDDAGIEAIIKPPVGVEVSIREGDGKKLLFVINHSEEPKTVSVPKGKTELLTGEKTKDSIKLERFEVAVIKL